MGEIEKNYKNLHYKLPKFSELDLEFEISTIDNQAFVLRSIRRKMIERMDMFAELIAGILQPEQMLCNIVEYGAFNEKEKKELMSIYKQIMFLCRQAYDLDLKCDNIDEAKFILSTHKSWKEIKRLLQPHITILVNSWKNNYTKKKDVRYLG